MTPTTFLMIWVVHARTQTSNFSLILQFERNPGLMGLVFLERWRGKKVMFVGDSLSLNVAITGLDCMIHSSVPNLILFPELREKSATDDRRKISNYHRLEKNRSSMDIVSLLDNSISDVCGSSVFLSLLTIVTVCIGLPRITTNNPSFSFPIPKKPNQN